MRIDLRGPDGTVYPMVATFREVVAPERLSFSSAALDGEGRPIFETLTTVSFHVPDGTGTEVRVHPRGDAKPHGRAGGLAGADGPPGGLRGPVGLAHDRRGCRDHRHDALGPVGGGPAHVRRRALDGLPRLHPSPTQLARWWGPRGPSNRAEEMDVRPGGVWRLTQRHEAGRDRPFAGEYREGVAPERLVFTQRDLAAPVTDEGIVLALTLEEHAGRTTLVTALPFASLADRDGRRASGMEHGMRQSGERLEEHLAAVEVAAETPWAGEIVASRIVRATRDRTWEVWTDARHVARWWGPTGFTTTVQAMDVRPGGVWRFEMHGPDGRDFDNEMVYAVVEPPGRLVCDHTVAPRFRQEVTLTDVGLGRTRVAVRSVFASAADAAPYAIKGLGQTLVRLAEAVA